ncbi:MAG: prefoldin subunit alpha [Nitrososphaerota archaeon]|nr:prefoldin subunit alpha [Nitrososphaerota archaeon]MDG6924851.1 prefoldin subunit alpha [Nitrososphaerota archaeon]MDG6958589.1 prefoldin subunit alpha [Nitrososphaerota archaeon]MDG6970376.1 prefoldin subunit alpha [Nitrososphaerota archaeon]MDG6977393.1 prefoldin subunit alpha [Nitrososphaerota archaeon]
MSTAEDAVNALVVEIRVLEGTYNELSARQNLLERAMLEGRAALDAIKGLSGQDSGEVLTQVGGGIMLRSSPPETERVLVSIGANVVVEKSRDEAVAILEERGRDIEKTLVSLVNQRNEIAQRLNSDREVLNSYMARSQQG